MGCNVGVDSEGFYPTDPNLPMGYDLYDNEEELWQSWHHNEQ